MRKGLLLLIILGQLLPPRVAGQTATSWMPANLSNATKKVCADGFGNIYLFTKYGLWNNYTDTITKIDTLGNVLSQTTLTGRRLVNMVLAPDKGFYLGGMYTGTLTVGNITYPSKGGIDIWFARYNSAGVLTWLKTYGSKTDDYLSDLCVHGNGLVMTGSLGDTTYINGQILPKPNQRELFITSFNDNGSLLAYKFAISTNSLLSQGSNTQISTAISKGEECEVDILGNVYILAQTTGKTDFDTLNIGEWGEDPEYPKNTITLLKLDAALNAQYKHIFSKYDYTCTYFYENLIVNTNSEPYIIYKYVYGQSGADAQMAGIYHLNSAGSVVGAFALRPEMKSDISDMEMDACGNLYFTGYWYTHWNTAAFYGACVTGELSPQLQLNWILNDSTQTSSPRGMGLCILGPNEYFVNGYSADTIIDNQGIFPNGNQHGFYAKVVGPADGGCAEVVDIPKQTLKQEALNIFPNPGSGKFSLTPAGNYADVRVYNTLGSQVFQEAHANEELNLKDLPAGMYVIRLRNPHGDIRTARVIIVK